jgi:hypothetical protein
LSKLKLGGYIEREGEEKQGVLRWFRKSRELERWANLRDVKKIEKPDDSLDT